MTEKKETEQFVNASVRLEEFFESLVRSVARGQSALEQYYRGTAEGRQSTVAYTIPSVALEVKLNFTVTTDRGICFFFKKTKETSTEVFSSMKLNLAAVPNPAVAAEQNTENRTPAAPETGLNIDVGDIGL
jgi:hypothetical protein